MFLVLLMGLMDVRIVIMLPCVSLTGGQYEEIIAHTFG